jgi:hypothetical protein
MGICWERFNGKIFNTIRYTNNNKKTNEEQKERFLFNNGETVSSIYDTSNYMRIERNLFKYP